MVHRIEWCGCSMQIARACMQFGRRQLDGDRKRLWRGRKTCRRFSRICRADLNESGTERQSRTLMSKIVQVSGNGLCAAFRTLIMYILGEKAGQ